MPTASHSLRQQALAQLDDASILPASQLQSLLEYHSREMIARLTKTVAQGDVRSNLPDGLMPARSDGRFPPIYLPAGVEAEPLRQAIERDMRIKVLAEWEQGHHRHYNDPEAALAAVMQRVHFEHLPTDNYTALREFLDQLPDWGHGHLYHPFSHVVPSGDRYRRTNGGGLSIIPGRFNNAFGWDAAMTAPALELSLSLDTLNAQKYLIDHYGGIDEQGQPFGFVPNINTTYGHRAHPPLFTYHVRLAWDKMQAEGVPEGLDPQAWLQGMVDSATRQYRHFRRPLMTSEASGLSRFYDEGSGRSREVIYCEQHRDAEGHSHTHFDLMRDFLRQVLANPEGHALPYDPQEFYDAATDSLTEKAYRADAAVRASGLDICGAWGPFGLGILDCTPVYLNAMLAMLERDIGWMHSLLGQQDQALEWEIMARERTMQIHSEMWNEKDGCYYDITTEPDAHGHFPQIPYQHASHFFTLWTGIAHPEHARRMIQEVLPNLLMSHGIAASAEVTGSQWDAPFAWGPLHLMMVDGLRRYARDWADSWEHLPNAPSADELEAMADRIALGFISNVVNGLRLEWDHDKISGWLQSQAERGEPVFMQLWNRYRQQLPAPEDDERQLADKRAARDAILAGSSQHPGLLDCPGVTIESLHRSEILHIRGNVMEKYLASGGIETGQHVTNGYSENVIGFGWTLGAVIHLVRSLSPECRQQLKPQNNILASLAAQEQITELRSIAA